MTRLAVGVVCAASVCTAVAAAQERPLTDAPPHNELRALRQDLTAAVKAGDIDGMLRHVHPDIVATFMDGRQVRGREEVRAYFETMLKGEDRVVDEYDAAIEIQELTTLYGDDAGVAAGRATNRFDLTDGREFVAEGPWTATVVRHEGRWVLAAFHSSASIFENGVLDMYRRWLTWAAVAAGLIGLAVGFGVGWMAKRRRPRPAVPADSV